MIKLKAPAFVGCDESLEASACQFIAAQASFFGMGDMGKFLCYIFRGEEELGVVLQ